MESRYSKDPYCSGAAAAAKSLQLCPTLCDPMDCSPPGSSVHEIIQARALEWVAIVFSTVVVSVRTFAFVIILLFVGQ